MPTNKIQMEYEEVARAVGIKPSGRGEKPIPNGYVKTAGFGGKRTERSIATLLDVGV
jgi:hypothetical protein